MGLQESDDRSRAPHDGAQDPTARPVELKHSFVLGLGGIPNPTRTPPKRSWRRSAAREDSRTSRFGKENIADDGVVVRGVARPPTGKENAFKYFAPSSSVSKQDAMKSPCGFWEVFSN